MYQILSGFLNTIRAWVGLVLPVFATAADFRHWPRWAWRVIHLLIVVGVLVGLYFVNEYFKVGTLLLTHRPELQRFYLPIVFLLLYALSWLGYWLWRLLGEEGEAADFPDVDDAWREAVAKLDEKGIGLADAPLYLILGRPAAGEDAFFQAAEQPRAGRAEAARGAQPGRPGPGHRAAAVFVQAHPPRPPAMVPGQRHDGPGPVGGHRERRRGQGGGRDATARLGRGPGGAAAAVPDIGPGVRHGGGPRIRRVPPVVHPRDAQEGADRPAAAAGAGPAAGGGAGPTGAGRAVDR